MRPSLPWRLLASIDAGKSISTKPLHCPAAPSFTLGRRPLCSHTSSCSDGDDGDVGKDNHNSTLITPQSRIRGDSVSLFFERSEATRNLTNLLNAKKLWNATVLSRELNAYSTTNNHIRLTSFLAAEVIRICRDVDPALHFFRWWKHLEESKKEADSWVYVSMMNRLGKSGRLEEMEAMAIECETEGLATVETFTVQLTAYRNKRCFDGVIRTWKRMEKLGIKPNIVSYTALLDVFSIHKMYDVAGDLYLHFLREGFFPNVKTSTVLIYHLADNGKLTAASDVFSELSKVKVKPNALTFSALMRGYAKFGHMDEVIELVRQFKEVGNRPHRYVFPGFFRFLLGNEKTRRVDEAERVMCELWPDSSQEDRQTMIVQYELETRSNSDTVTMGSYTCDSVSPSELIIENSYSDDEDADDECAATNNASFWNYIGLVRCMTPWTPTTAMALSRANVKWDGHLVSELMKRISRPDVGWKFFSWVEGKNGFSHDEFTYSRMIQLLLTDSDFERTKKLLVEAQSKKLDLSLHTYNHVLKFCGLKCEANIALEVFDLLKAAGLEPDRVSYQNLIHALHKCGRYWRVATVCAEMERAGFGLDSIIYSFVVCGFARAGKMKYARAFYNRMRNHGFEPSEHFYKAFIMGFYRAGKLDKAEAMFMQMKRSGMSPSSQLCDLMVEVFRKNRNEKALEEVQRERKSMTSMKSAEKRKMLEMYLKFHQHFVGSLARDDDDDDDDDVMNAEGYG